MLHHGMLPVLDPVTFSPPERSGPQESDPVATKNDTMAV